MERTDLYHGKEKFYCERCQAKLNKKTMVWLELDNTTGCYTDKELPEGHISQGCFTFGKDCAKAILAENQS